MRLSGAGRLQGRSGSLIARVTRPVPSQSLRADEIYLKNGNHRAGSVTSAKIARVRAVVAIFTKGSSRPFFPNGDNP